MTQGPDNLSRTEGSPAPSSPEATPPRHQKIPFPAPHAHTNFSREIKAKVISGNSYLDRAIKSLKTSFIVKLFARLFPATKPAALSITDANFRLLKDDDFAKKYGASLDLYLNREEKLKLFNELNRLIKNLSDEEKLNINAFEEMLNINAFISAYVQHADPDEIEFLEAHSGLSNLFNIMRQEGIETRADTFMDRYGHYRSTVAGRSPLGPELDQIRKGTHFNRKEFVELMASSITKFGQQTLSKIRVGELAQLAKEDISEKSESLQVILVDSSRLMEAIKGDILRDEARAGIKNSFEFYIELAEQLAKQGDANGLIIVLAVLLDPEMEPVLRSANISPKHQDLLNNLEKKADEIDAFGNLSENPALPSGMLLIDRFKEATRGKPIDVVSDEVMSPLGTALDMIEGLQAPNDPPLYNLEGFVKSRTTAADPKKVGDTLESDLDHIYSVLEKAQSSQKLRFTPEGLVAKERSILSRFTNRLAGKKDPAKNAVQYILAKVDRALDQDSPQLDKIGHILDFLNHHTWSKIVLNKNEPLQILLKQLEEKHQSKINKADELQKQQARTDIGLIMLDSFLSDIDDTRRLILVRSISGSYNLMSTQKPVSKETLNNLHQLLLDAEKYPELKEKAVNLLDRLYKTSWFEESLKNHKEIGNDIVVLGRRMAQRWEAPNVPQ